VILGVEEPRSNLKFAAVQERSVDLLPSQGFVVPKGVMHCTRAPERSVMLMVERRGRSDGRCLEISDHQKPAII
jgi:hypothetical protein